MLVVDMSIEMRLGTKLLITAVVGALVFAIMVTLVMVKFMDLVKVSSAFLTDMTGGLW